MRIRASRCLSACLLGSTFALLALALPGCQTHAPSTPVLRTHLEDPLPEAPPASVAGDTRDGKLTLSLSEPIEGPLAAALDFFAALIEGDRQRLSAAIEEELLRVNPRATSYTRSKASLLGTLLHPSRRAHLGEGEALSRLVDVERTRSLSIDALYGGELPEKVRPSDHAVEIRLTREGVRAFRGGLPGADERFVVLVRGEPPYRIFGL